MKVKTNVGASKKNKLNAVRLEFHDKNARTVCIAGTFNGWNPKTTPMLTNGPGQWLKDISLRAGGYEYQYVVDGKWVNDPHAVKSTPNPYGGRNSVLMVEKNSSMRGTTFQPQDIVRETKTENGKLS